MKSPCRACENEFVDKSGCIEDCTRLQAFQACLVSAQETRLVGISRPVLVSHNTECHITPEEPEPAPAPKPDGRKKINCAECGKETRNFGRGLCAVCYSRARYAEIRQEKAASLQEAARLHAEAALQETVGAKNLLPLHITHHMPTDAVGGGFRRTDSGGRAASV